MQPVSQCTVVDRYGYIRHYFRPAVNWHRSGNNITFHFSWIIEHIMTVLYCLHLLSIACSRAATSPQHAGAPETTNGRRQRRTWGQWHLVGGRGQALYILGCRKIVEKLFRAEKNYFGKFSGKIKILSIYNHLNHLCRKSQLSVGIQSEICSVCRKITTFCPAYFFTHDAVAWGLYRGPRPQKSSHFSV